MGEAELRAPADPREQGYAAFGCGAQPTPEIAADADALSAWCDGWIEAKDVIERFLATPPPGGDGAGPGTGEGAKP